MSDKSSISIVLLIIPVIALVVISDQLAIRLFERIATLLCINLILVLGLQVFMGNSGILSFAHMGFMGIGAYTSAVLTIPVRMKGMALPDLYQILATMQISPFAGMIAGAVAAALVAAVISFPLMRLSDAAAVITSFALLMVLHTIMVHWSQVTNGPRTLFGLPKATTLYISAGAACLMIVVAMLFKESRTGLLLRAVRDDDVAASAIGCSISVLRWRGFILSAFMAGLGGGLWGHFITSFSPSAFYLKETFVILGMLVIGGSMTVSGAVLGTFAVTGAFEGLRTLENAINIAHLLPKPVVGLTEVVLASVMILVLVLRPVGIIGTTEIGALVVASRRRPDSKNALGRKNK
jgi:branched-chain amino acid transport system permease protein